MKRHHLSIICLALLCFEFTSEAYAEKKGFTGLFGSYRREKFTENEANKTDFGMDLMLSTLLPLNPVAKSAESSALNFQSLNYATFFNFEASFWVSLGYNWVVFANFGKYSYDTRKQNADSLDSSKDPRFHKFELDAIPGIIGLRYRLSNEDIVPYVSLGLGMAYTHRVSSTEGSTVGGTNRDEEYQTVACGQGTVGLEFYFAPKAGLRVEASAFYMNLPQRTYNPGADPKFQPVIQYQANIWSMRYASGLFFLF